MAPRPAPSREQVLDAVETVLDATLIEVTVTQDGHPVELATLVRILDNYGLIDYTGVPRD